MNFVKSVKSCCLGCVSWVDFVEYALIFEFFEFFSRCLSPSMSAHATKSATFRKKAAAHSKVGLIGSFDELMKLAGHEGVVVKGQNVSLTMDAPFIFYRSMERLQAELIRLCAKGQDASTVNVARGHLLKAMEPFLQLSKILQTVNGRDAVVSHVLCETPGQNKSPKLRPPVKADMSAAFRVVEKLEQQPKRGRKHSVSNTTMVRDLRGVKVLSDETRSAVLQATLPVGCGVQTKNVADADIHFWLRGHDAPPVQVCVTGTASHCGDMDALLQLAVAKRGTLLICVSQCALASGGKLEVHVADACATRHAVIGEFCPKMARWVATKQPDDKSAFARPFDPSHRPAWLVAQFVTSQGGSQDYAKGVMVKRAGKAAKKLWSTTAAKGFDPWMRDEVEKRKPDFTLSNFFNNLRRYATGMLWEVTKEASFAEFKNDFRQSLFFAGLATIRLTQQGEDAEAAWRLFCGVPGDGPVGPQFCLVELQVKPFGKVSYCMHVLFFAWCIG